MREFYGKQSTFQSQLSREWHVEHFEMSIDTFSEGEVSKNSLVTSFYNIELEKYSDK